MIARIQEIARGVPSLVRGPSITGEGTVPSLVRGPSHHHRGDLPSLVRGPLSIYARASKDNQRTVKETDKEDISNTRLGLFGHQGQNSRPHRLWKTPDTHDPEKGEH